MIKHTGGNIFSSFSANIKIEIPGVMLAAAIGIIAFFLAPLLDVNSVLTGLILGILIGNLVKIPSGFLSGISFTSGKLLELSILFLAFSINLTHIVKLGTSSFVLIAAVVLIILIVTKYLSAKLKLPGSTGLLIGFGTSICGSSAIAALAPGISKNKEDVGISIAVVNLFGTIGMISLPLILKWMETSYDFNGLILGGSLHSVGNVAGAGYSMGDETGEASITIKLTRVALLSPALIFFNYLIRKNTVENWKEHFRLPWYLWCFILITIFNSFVKLPVGFISLMEESGKIVLTVAMAAIGLKISFKILYQSGKKGVLFGLIIFVIQLVLIVLGAWFLIE